MRIRLRTERRLDELIAAEQDAGRLAKRYSGNRNLDSSVSRLSDIGIPHDRSARAQELACVPVEQANTANLTATGTADEPTGGPATRVSAIG
jgi:hypothetical protein